MSTLASTTLQDRASGKNLPTLSMIKGAAKLWGYYIWGTGVPTISNSFGAASLNDAALGNLNVNHTTPMVGPYAVVCNTWARTSWVNKAEGAAILGMTTHQIYAMEAGALTDPSFAHSAVFGDLA